jgi:hypothetical protein
MFFHSFHSFWTSSISKIEPSLLKSIVENGYTESMNLLKRTLPNSRQNEFDFFYNYSTLEIEDNRGYSVPTFSLLNINIEKVDLSRVRGVRYEFVYKYNNNIGLYFTIFHDLQKGTFFFNEDTETKLKILDSLKIGYCKPCILSLQKYIRRNKIKDYHVGIEWFGKMGKLERTFVWAIIISDKESINKDSPFLSGGRAVFIDPLTGKKADMSNFFVPPTISE